MRLLWVALGGVIGGGLRYGLTLLLPAHPYPLGTWIVNLVGCFAVGILTWAMETGPVPAWLSCGVGTGVIGSFTTFSTLCLDTITLAHTCWCLAALYVVTSLVGGVLCAYTGHLSAQWLWRRVNLREVFS